MNPIIKELNDGYAIWLKKKGKTDEEVRTIENSILVTKSELKDISGLVMKSDCSTKFSQSGTIIHETSKTRSYLRYMPEGFDVWVRPRLIRSGNLKRHLRRRGIEID